MRSRKAQIIADVALAVVGLGLFVYADRGGDHPLRAIAIVVMAISVISEIAGTLLASVKGRT